MVPHTLKKQYSNLETRTFKKDRLEMNDIAGHMRVNRIGTEKVLCRIHAHRT